VDRCSGKTGNSAAKASICLLAIAAALACGAIGTPAAESDKQADPVYITAEHLLADTAGHWAEFSGDVQAVQGATKIRAERLKVYYHRQDDASQKAQAAGSDSGAGQIERIEASGRVSIHFDQRVAESDEARYTAADRILVLTGRPARVTEGANTVSGGRIVMDRDKNRLTVEKQEEGRVEAVFFTRDKGLQ
jgi:lipopolysaccharide export system protein LptA